MVSETDLMVSDWFQTTLKLAFFFKEGSETTCFSIHGHPEPSSDGFRGVSEWFQRSLKLCGFRMVSEGSETVWCQSGSEGLKSRGFRVVSEWSETAWFQSGFRGV